MLFEFRMLSAFAFAVALKLASSAAPISICSCGNQALTGTLTAGSNTQGPSNGLNLRLKEV